MINTKIEKLSFFKKHKKSCIGASVGAFYFLVISPFHHFAWEHQNNLLNNKAISQITSLNPIVKSFGCTGDGSARMCNLNLVDGENIKVLVREKNIDKKNELTQLDYSFENNHFDTSEKETLSSVFSPQTYTSEFQEKVQTTIKDDISFINQYIDEHRELQNNLKIYQLWDKKNDNK